MVQNVHKFRRQNLRLSCAGAHCQLVSKITHGGQAHAGNAEVFAKGGDVLHVKLVERDDPINRLRPGLITHCVNQALQRQLFRHGEHFIDAFKRPVGVPQLLDGQQQHAATHALACADKLLPLFIGTDAENGKRPAV